MQADYIMREIEKIAKLIEAILVKLRILKKENRSELLYATAKTELSEKLDIDLDGLLANGNPAEVLVTRYGFSNGDLEKFAKLLFDLIAPATGGEERTALIHGIEDIYRYLERKTATFSFDQYYMLKELESLRNS